MFLHLNSKHKYFAWQLACSIEHHIKISDGNYDAVLFPTEDPQEQYWNF